MRSLLAGAAAIWFVYNATSWLPLGGTVYLNDGAPGGLDGDPGAVAIAWAARALFGGLALIALALVDWGQIDSLLRSAGPRD